MNITLDTITFADFATSGWVYQSLVDWFGGTDDKMPNNERPNGHGSFPVGKSLRASRAISFKAIYLASTLAEAESAVDDLVAAVALGPVKMTVSTDRGTTWRWVTASVSFEDNRQEPEAVVTVDLIARDPRRYADSPWEQAGAPTAGQGRTWPAVYPLVWPGGGATGRFTLTNTGNAPAAPSFRISGAVDGVTITMTETGQRIGLGRPIASGDFVLIDGGLRRALYNGVADTSRWLQFREWAEIPPRSARTFQFDPVNPGAGALLEGQVLSAWW